MRNTIALVLMVAACAGCANFTSDHLDAVRAACACHKGLSHIPPHIAPDHGSIPAVCRDGTELRVPRVPR